LKPAIKFASLVVTVAALASLALGQDARVYREGSNWVQEMNGTLNAARNLRVKVTAGSVHVQGGSGSGITYAIHRHAYTSSEQEARRQFDAQRINAVVKGDTAWIVVESLGGHNQKCSDDVVVNVPRNIDLAKIETGGGTINATGIGGRAEINSGGGSLHIDDIGGDLAAETGGGTIEIGTVQGSVNLQTGGGTIKIASVKGEIRAASGGGSLVVQSGQQGAILETGAGSIRVDKCGGRVKASTGGGSVEMGEIGGPAEIESGAGSIRLASANGHVHAETGGGSIQLNGVTSVQAETSAGGIVVKMIPASNGAARSDSSLSTSAGDITVYLANNLAISVRANIELADGHSIRSDFPDIHVSTEGGEYGPKTVTAEGKLNGGGPWLKVRTNSGNVNFRRVNQ